MKQIKSCVILILIAMMLLFPVVSADTGTYTIEDQTVNLAIRTDGNVNISYSITMSVQSGNIPWVTVGLPNSNFNIINCGGSARNIKSQNSGSWSGVYFDLDKTYYSGDSFTFNFLVMQIGFIYKYKTNQSSIQFTPCWWDNAIIKKQQVTFTLPPQVQNVITTVEGATFGNSTVTWQWTNVPKGSKITVGLIMNASAFTSLSGESSSFNIGDNNLFLFFLLMLFLGIVLVLFVVFRSPGRDDYEEPTVNASSTKKTTRHINMKCPADNSNLNKRTIKGTTIDFCNLCGGVYFDKSEVEELLVNHVDESDFNTAHITLFHSYADDVDINKCPRCEGKLLKVERKDDSKTHVIYVCDDCRGIWMDKGSFQMVKDKRAEQNTAFKSSLTGSGSSTATPVSRDTWLFYPYIYYPLWFRKHDTVLQAEKKASSTAYHSSSSSCVHSSCVSCACVAACAACCACAGGGAAGCAPKNKIEDKKLYNQICFEEKQ